MYRPLTDSNTEHDENIVAGDCSQIFTYFYLPTYYVTNASQLLFNEG